MSFLAATILPACSSKQAAAIHPGACFGFDLTRESKSIRALLISPISASDLMATLSSDVRYPLGSTEVAVPEVVPDTWSSLSDRILSRACPISTKLVSVPEFAGVSNPPVACDRRSAYMGARRQCKMAHLLVSVQRALVFCRSSVPHDNTIGDGPRPFKIPFSFLSGEIAHLWDVGPFFVSYRSETPLEINKLLL